MSSSNSRLLDLTPEILLHIASYCEGLSLLRLTQTCHHLKSLFQDVVSYQKATFTYVGHPSDVGELLLLN